MKTAADWCIEGLAHDLVVSEEQTVRARNDAAIWRDLARMSMWWLWAVLAENERLKWEAMPEEPPDLDRLDER